MSQNFNILCTRNVLVSSGEDLHSGRIIKSFNLQNPDIQFWCWVLLSWRKIRDKIYLSYTIHNRPRKGAMVRMIETEQCFLSTDVDVGATNFYLRCCKKSTINCSHLPSPSLPGSRKCKACSCQIR